MKRATTHLVPHRSPNLTRNLLPPSRWLMQWEWGTELASKPRETWILASTAADWPPSQLLLQLKLPWRVAQVSTVWNIQRPLNPWFKATKLDFHHQEQNHSVCRSKTSKNWEGTAQKMSSFFSLSAIYGFVFSEIGMRGGSVEERLHSACKAPSWTPDTTVSQHIYASPYESISLVSEPLQLTNHLSFTLSVSGERECVESDQKGSKEKSEGKNMEAKTLTSTSSNLQTL